MPTAGDYDKYEALKAIIRQLRSPDGCPWDRKQSPESIRKYLLEESRELAEAIDTSDHHHVCEEIGDLLYILTMLISMHEEKMLFTESDVFRSICAKMIRRHPHVFTGRPAGSEEELRRQWQEIKNTEK